MLASSGLKGEEVAKRILIVDDGDEVRQVLRAIIESRTPYEVCGEASNGLQGVEKALELKPDLVLLDLAMPMLNGVEVASVLAGALPKLPVVLYTMYNEMLGLSLASAVGARAVVSKADGMSKLLECIQNLLEPNSQAANPQPALTPLPVTNPTLPDVIPEKNNNEGTQAASKGKL